MKIYLAGSVPKEADKHSEFPQWRLQYKKILEQSFDAEFIMPRAGEIDESDALLVVGKDSQSIKICDLVVVNAEEKIGAGTAMELVIAKHFKKPVVTVLPKNSHHRKSVVFEGKPIDDWKHPFIDVFSDIVVERVEDITSVADQLKTIKVKDISIIDEAVAHRESFGA